MFAPHMYRYIQRPEESIRCPETVVTGGYEPLDTNAVAETHVFYKGTNILNY